MSVERTEAVVALAERLAKSLKFAEISPVTIADELGVTEATVQAWLHGIASPRLAHLMVWAQRCRVPFEWLTGTENET